MAGNYFRQTVWRSGNFGQARYELSTAALRLGLTTALEVGYACDQTKNPVLVAQLLDEGKTDEVCRIAMAYLNSLKK